MLRGVITDIDGTLTDEKRRLSTAAIETIRQLQEGGVEVVLASGNTSCLLKGLSKLIGTSGTFIGENGGVYRIGFDGDLRTISDRKIVLDSLRIVEQYYTEKGVRLEMYSLGERFTDVAFARKVPVDEVRDLLRDWPVAVMDTNFAIHIHQVGIDKGKTFQIVSENIGIPMEEFLAIGDSENDIGMIQRAGAGCCVANAEEDVRSVSGYCAVKSYGEGFVEIMRTYFPHILAR
ncbi:MAG: phosphoglycolate phosphatase [Methanospirillum sp.]|nr:phosphoglycolate phosphatase [Methanospirillum sp.]